MKKSVIVVGGGIVGVCNALALCQAGHQVTLIDRKQPGRETSYGNAGVLSLTFGSIHISKLGSIGEVISSRPLNIEAFKKR